MKNVYLKVLQINESKNLSEMISYIIEMKDITSQVDQKKEKMCLI